jgi:hypothetical protein
MEQSREIAIANAKLVLKQAGYYVDNLWHVDDIKINYDCDDDMAQFILNEVLSDGQTIQYINELLQEEIDFIYLTSQAVQSPTKTATEKK